jgi:hypothetical protein
MRVPLLRPLAAGLIAAALLAPAASAASPVEITLTVVSFGGAETFTASGGFCASGTATSSDFWFAGGGRASTFHLDKTFTCANGTDSLTIHLNAATANGSPQDQGGWKVVSGTGAYEGIHGGGNLVGIYTDTGGVIDHYVGVLTR